METELAVPPEHLSQIERWYRRYFALIFVAATIVLLIFNSLSGFFDWLFFSGVLLFLIGLVLAIQFPERLRHALTQIVDRGGWAATSQQLTAFEQEFFQEAHGFSRRVAIIVAAALLLVFLAVDSYFVTYAIQQQGHLPRDYYVRLIGQILFIGVEVTLAYIVGRYIGRAVAYGRLGSAMQDQHIAIHVQVNHLDGAAGLGSIGGFYFFQASLLSIPALYLAVWWILISLVPILHVEYSQWLTPYLLLLGIVVVVEIFAFVVPMLGFHHIMLAQKSVLLREADQLSALIAEHQAKLVSPTDNENGTVLRDQITAMTNRYQAIQSMPTWPVDVHTWRRFSLGTAALLLPYVAQVLDLSTLWQRLRSH